MVCTAGRSQPLIEISGRMTAPALDGARQMPELARASPDCTVTRVFTMANAFTPSDIPLEQRTVGAIMSARAEEFGDKPFVVTTDGASISSREIHRRSNQLAHGAADFGIEFQEPVLVMLPDTLDYLVVWAGLGKRGAIEVPVNLAYRKSILRRLCNDSTAKKIIIDREHVDRLEEIIDESKSE